MSEELNSQEALKEALEIRGTLDNCELPYFRKENEQLKQKLQQLADEHKFEGGCGKIFRDKSVPTMPHAKCGLEVDCRRIFYCPDCQAKKKIQKIKKEVLG